MDINAIVLLGELRIGMRPLIEDVYNGGCLFAADILISTSQTYIRMYINDRYKK